MNQQVSHKNSFPLLTNFLRGPDEMASRAGFGLAGHSLETLL